MLRNAMDSWIHESYLYPHLIGATGVLSYGDLSGTPLCLVSV